MKPETRERLESFRTIEAGWDTYDGRPIDPACIDAAIAFYERIGDECVPRFAVFPTPEGGVQVEADEFGEPHGYLEFEFHPDGRVSGLFMASIMDGDSPEDFEVKAMTTDGSVRGW